MHRCLRSWCIALLIGFGLGISETFYFNGNRYTTCTDSCTEFYQLPSHKSSYQGSQGTFPFCPYSSLSNTCLSWNWIIFSSLPPARLRNASQVGARLPSLHSPPVCHIALEIPWGYHLSFVLPTRWLCRWNSLFGTNQGTMVHYKPLVYLSWHLLRTWTEACKPG